MKEDIGPWASIYRKRILAAAIISSASASASAAQVVAMLEVGGNGTARSDVVMPVYDSADRIRRTGHWSAGILIVIA